MFNDNIITHGGWAPWCLTIK